MQKVVKRVCSTRILIHSYGSCNQKNHAIFTRQEIDSLWKKARRVVKHDGLHILLAPRSGNFGRLLLVVPKRIGTAPIRNKLRRQLKHIFYEQKFHEGDRDWIVIARPAVSQLDFSALQKLLLHAFSIQFQK